MRVDTNNMTSPELIQRARELRKDPTEAEALLWTQLRNRRLGGFKFRRQHPYEVFILDFYCKEARLGIEVDGGIHKIKSSVEYDQDRTEILEEEGVKIIRFWNSEVMNDLEGVVEKILAAVNARIEEINDE